MKGWPAVVKSCRGYSQGDYWEVLAVATPEFQTAFGNAPEYWTDGKALKQSIQLFEDWVIGNVYGYSVEKDGETVESCWGFFGDYDAEYSALSEAKSVIDTLAEAERLERFAQVKAWIRNRVPLGYRHFAV